MELKVWVEGIQRVICGVTESTTCQDVVIALAHATGKTGRFTLVEKWRENERLLAPTENPLKVLHKWGEYAVDVTFILRHSEKSRSRHKHNDPLGRTDKFSHNFSPHQKSPGHGVGIKKSFTFSGAHTPSPQHAGKGSRSARTLPDNSSLESLDEQSSVASYSSRSSVSPYASLEKKKKHKHNHVPPLYSPVGSPERKKIPNSVDSSPVRSNGSTPPNYHEIRPKRGTSSQSCKYVNSHESSKAKTAVDIHNLHRQSPGGGSHEGSDRGEEKFRRKDFEKKVTHSDDVGRDNLIKLITLQQDRLQVQETQLKATDSEIKFWEQREKDHDQQAKILNDEIRKLQFSEREIDDELQELDLVSWVDKLEIEKQHEKMTESELTLMRSKLANCESELLQCKNKIHLLMSQIEGEKREQEQQQKEHRAQETKLQLEICDLQKEMKDKVVEYEEWQCTIDELLVELKNLDSAISEKNTDISSIEKDLKQANLDYFMTVPTLPSQDGEGGFSRLSPSRPGSARKMTSSPQRLGEAVPTTRNPHGMWV